LALHFFWLFFSCLPPCQKRWPASPCTCNGRWLHSRMAGLLSFRCRSVFTSSEFCVLLQIRPTTEIGLILFFVVTHLRHDTKPLFVYINIPYKKTAENLIRFVQFLVFRNPPWSAGELLWLSRGVMRK
jgi:hypothetical protein